MKKINLRELYTFQSHLDADIAKKHNVTYELTHSERLLALIVEIGELANETRCFKYWSTKGPSTKETIMDEFADGMHFFLSLGIPLKNTKYEFDLKRSRKDLTIQFLNVYKAAIALFNRYDLKHYRKAFQLYLNLSQSLGMTSEDIIDSYKKKLSVNYKRQQSNY